MPKPRPRGPIALACACASACLLVMGTSSTRASGHAAPAREGPPASGATLPPGAEDILRWGPPARGLRLALVIGPSQIGPDGLPDLYLVVQNVTDGRVRLVDVVAGPDRRKLTLKDDGKIQMIIGTPEATGTDLTLGPREVAFLPVFPAQGEGRDAFAGGALIAEGGIKDPHQSFSVEMRIDRAADGAWTGRLQTGEVTAAQALRGHGFVRPPRGDRPR